METLTLTIAGVTLVLVLILCCVVHSLEKIAYEMYEDHLKRNSHKGSEDGKKNENDLSSFNSTPFS